MNFLPYEVELSTLNENKIARIGSGVQLEVLKTGILIGRSYSFSQKFGNGVLLECGAALFGSLVTSVCFVDVFFRLIHLLMCSY